MKKNNYNNFSISENRLIKKKYGVNGIPVLLTVLALVFNSMISNAQPPLCGTYLIGASQPVGFKNLTQALVKLHTQGVSCDVTFELQADYTSTGETFPIVINQFQQFNTK